MTRHHLNILGFLFNCCLVITIFQGQPMMWILLGISALLFLVFLTIGVILPNRNYFLKIKTHLKSDKVLLTFDDGPDVELTPKVLAILEKYNVGAIFFVIGDKVNENPEMIQTILSQGHLLGNHTQTHPLMFAAISQEHVEKEIGLCDNTIHKVTGDFPTIFRPPIGYTNPRIARAVKKMKKRVVGWSLRSFDSVFKDEEKLLQRVVSKVRPGNIVLFHDNLPQTIAILEEFIVASQKRGIKFANTKELKTIIS